MMAVCAIPAAFLMLLGISTVTELSPILQFLVPLIGLGVSIDYSLLIVVRWREERDKGLANEDAVRETFRAFVDNGVPFTIATDGPEMMRTHLRDEFELLTQIGALDEDELVEANRRGHEASFVGAVEPSTP